MITYNDFLDRLHIPSEKEFNEIIKNLPPFDELDVDFDYSPDYDDLYEKLFEYGFLSEYNCVYIGSMNYENKRVELGDIETLEELEDINNKLTAAGWTLVNYDEEKCYQEEEAAKEKEQNERDYILNEIRNSNLTAQQIKEAYENYIKG